MTREEIIKNLKYTMEKHKNDYVHTFDTNISLMCKDILDYLEQEPILDKIRTKIDLDTRIQVKHYTNTDAVIDAVLEVIDNYKAEP